MQYVICCVNAVYIRAVYRCPLIDTLVSVLNLWRACYCVVSELILAILTPSTPAPPPSYNDVVGAVPSSGSGEPSAPPLSHVAAATPLMTHHTRPGYDAGDSLRMEDNTRRGE